MAKEEKLMAPLGKEYGPEQRKAFLKDNCDSVEEKAYRKKFTPEQMQGYKEDLANVVMQLGDITEEKKAVMQDFKDRMKPLEEKKDNLVDNIRNKSELVRKICYKFVSQDERITRYYNEEGDCIECRPCTADEMQMTIAQPLRKTGTEG